MDGTFGKWEWIRSSGSLTHPLWWSPSSVCRAVEYTKRAAFTFFGLRLRSMNILCKCHRLANLLYGIFIDSFFVVVSLKNKAKATWSFFFFHLYRVWKIDLYSGKKNFREKKKANTQVTKWRTKTENYITTFTVVAFTTRIGRWFIRSSSVPRHIPLSIFLTS